MTRGSRCEEQAHMSTIESTSQSAQLSGCFCGWLSGSFSASLNCWLRFRVTLSMNSISANASHHECECERERARDCEHNRGREIQRAKHGLVWIVNHMNKSLYLNENINECMGIELGFTFGKTWHVWFWILSQKLNMEIIEFEAVKFPENGTYVLSVVVVLARACTIHNGSSKVRNSLWLRKRSQTLICVGCRRRSQSHQINRWRKYYPVVSQKQLSHFGPTCDLKIFRFADPRCILFVLKNIWKQRVCVVPGPPGAGACWASDPKSFRRPLQKKVRFKTFLQPEHQNSLTPCPREATSTRGDPPKVT